jgi:hypothetical protein
MTFKGEITGRHEYEGHCVTAIEFRTNGPQGGGASSGGFLEITFENLASTCLEAAVNREELQEADSIKLKFKGDAEMEAAFQCFEFLVTKLRAVKAISD